MERWVQRIVCDAIWSGWEPEIRIQILCRAGKRGAFLWYREFLYRRKVREWKLQDHDQQRSREELFSWRHYEIVQWGWPGRWNRSWCLGTEQRGISAGTGICRNCRPWQRKPGNPGRYQMVLQYRCILYRWGMYRICNHRQWWANQHCACRSVITYRQWRQSGWKHYCKCKRQQILWSDIPRHWKLQSGK